MTMELLYPHCCGLDVHKSSITACVRIQEKIGKPRKIVRRFGAMTADLRALANWLMEQQVTHVAMESTGVVLQRFGRRDSGPAKLIDRVPTCKK
jgi:transposase